MEKKITMEDVYRDWDSKIARTIIDAGVPFDLVDDVKSEIYLSMVRRDLCSRFDPTRAKSFSTYLYKIVHSLILNQFRNLHRKKSIPVESVTYLGTGTELEDSGLFSEVMYSYDTLEAIEQLSFVEALLRELDQQPSQKVIRGKSGELSLQKAVLMVLDGYSVRDIADSIGTHAETVKRSLKHIKGLPPLVELVGA